jgi:hypothetical protein
MDDRAFYARKLANSMQFSMPKALLGKLEKVIFSAAYGAQIEKRLRKWISQRKASISPFNWIP